MAIRGNLSEASLADVLQLLALGQKTGCLSVAREGSFGTVHFVRGRIVHAAIVNRRDRLGDRLVRSGALSAEGLARAIDLVAPADDRDLAVGLLERELVAHDVLMVQYRAQVEEAAYHLFAWNTGTFTFEPETHSTDSEPLLSVSADTLLLEGARRVDEWTLIAKKIPTLDLIFELDTKRLAQSDVALSTTQQRLVLMLDGATDVLALVERSGIDEFEVGKALFGLITAGFAQRVGRSAARRQPPPESRVTEHRNLGVAFYRTGMLDEAQREFRRVLDLRETDGAARFFLGLVYLRRNEWQEAIDTLQQVAQAIDAPAAVYHNLAYAFEQLGRLDDAQSALRNATTRSSTTDPRIALSEAVIALRRGDLPQADERLAASRAAWGSRQPTAAWYHAAGLAAALAGDATKAIATLDEGLALHPHAAALHNNLAVVHERRGSYELAARTLEHALLEDANRAHLHKNLGDYLYRAQRYDEAFESLTRVVRLDSAHGADVYLKLGNIHYRRGVMDDARGAWERALEIEPNNRIVGANLEALRRADPAGSPDVMVDAALAGHTG